jgi:hypothetical protein
LPNPAENNARKGLAPAHGRVKSPPMNTAQKQFPLNRVASKTKSVTNYNNMNANKALIALTAALVLHTTSALAVVFTSNTTIAIGVTTYDGQDIVVSNCTLTVNGPHSFASLLVTSNGLVTHSPAPTGTAANSLNLTIAQDATIEAGGVISAVGKGYGAQSGPGQGNDYGSGGGGYGGEGGGALGGTNYGSITAPVDFGSGGGNTWTLYGPAGAGGGCIRLTVGGTLTISGQILANGQNGIGYGAGGSGGSVYVTAGMLAGGSVIQATGGNGANGGAGGRIALYYTTSTFTGTATAFGGTGTVRGGAGTLYLKAASQAAGTVIVDNGGLSGAQTPLFSPVLFHLTVTNAGIVRSQAALNLASLLVASNGLVVDPSTQPRFPLAVQGDATVENGGSMLTSNLTIYGNLLIAGGGAILASCNLTIHGNLLIASGGAISANGKGFGTDAGLGKGTADYYSPSGAGYGGLGGGGWAGSGQTVGGGTVYGSQLQPVDLGSGGGHAGVSGSPGGAGGGAVRLNVDGTLTVNGQLTANGSNGTGGGSGGSLFVSAGTLTGIGMISAIGGGGVGGGGGGRIALYYGNSTFAGNISAVGGLGSASLYSGGPGTIYTKPNSQAFGALLIDGTGRTNAMETPITSPEPFALVLSNATVYPNGPLLLGSLLITTNATITHPAGGPQIQIAVLGDATIDAGAGMGVDGRGYGSTMGPGHGLSTAPHGSGAGYGGTGGDCLYFFFPGWNLGGPAYGSVSAPVDFGSGGGSASDYGRPGGAGGGAIRLSVTGTFLVNGRVTANGRDGVVDGLYHGSGGGSGGSVFLTVGRLAGNGAITANGGATGDANSGGGGGGRIAIYSDTNVFIGTMTASGAAGLHWGGTGTIYLGTNVAPIVIAQYPSGPVNRFVSYVDVTFNQPVDPATFTTNDLVLTAPSGPIPLSQITLTGGGGVTWRIGFPTQMANGDYSIQLDPHIANLFGQEMTASYSGGFTVNFTTPTATASKTGGNLSLIWPSATGLSYQLQSATNLPAASWLNEGAPLNGTGGLLTNNLPIGAQPRKFFRFLLLEN